MIQLELFIIPVFVEVGGVSSSFIIIAFPLFLSFDEIFSHNPGITLSKYFPCLPENNILMSDKTT